MFDLIKQYYREGYYQKTDLDLFVNVGLITSEKETEILNNNPA